MFIERIIFNNRRILLLAFQGSIGLSLITLTLIGDPKNYFILFKCWNLECLYVIVIIKSCKLYLRSQSDLDLSYYKSRKINK